MPSSARRRDSSLGSASTTGHWPARRRGRAGRRRGSAGGEQATGRGPEPGLGNSFVFFVVRRVRACSPAPSGSGPARLALRCSRKARWAGACHAGAPGSGCAVVSEAACSAPAGRRRGAAGVARRDVGQHLGLEPVGADLAPHRGGDRGDQLLLGGVHGAVALLRSCTCWPHPRRPPRAARPNSRARSPCLSAFMAERALPSGVLGPRFFGGGGGSFGHGGVSGTVAGWAGR